MKRLPRETRLGWLLCLPSIAAMLLVTAYPMLYSVWLSLHRFDLRFPDEREFVGLGNYVSVLGSVVWWESLLNTAVIMCASVALELVLGFAFALVMHRALVGRGIVRASLLVPYAVITVVAALAFRFAFDPTTGFVSALTGMEGNWLGGRASAFFVIVMAEVWKTTPFMALLLLAGLALVPAELLNAARADGANTLQRFIHVTLPLMRPAIAVALIFRTLDAFRVFDTVFVLTRGALGTETVSMVGYRALVTRLNLGLGSAVAVLVFVAAIMIAIALVRFVGSPAEARRQSPW